MYLVKRTALTGQGVSGVIPQADPMQGASSRSLMTTASPDGKTVTIRLTERFDFSTHRTFRSAYEPHMEPGIHFIIDFAHTEHMDSCALGTLLLLRQHVGGDSATITLTNCKGPILQMLRVAAFPSLFHVEAAAD